VEGDAVFVGVLNKLRAKRIVAEGREKPAIPALKLCKISKTSLAKMRMLKGGPVMNTDFYGDMES